LEAVKKGQPRETLRVLSDSDQDLILSRRPSLFTRSISKTIYNCLIYFDNCA